MLPRPGDVPEDVVTEAEKKGLQRAAQFPATGNAYAREHGTRPATIGLVLSSSPLALLAWMSVSLLTQLAFKVTCTDLPSSQWRKIPALDRPRPAS